MLKGAKDMLAKIYANFGILDPLPCRVKGKKNRYEQLSAVAIQTVNEVIKNYEL